MHSKKWFFFKQHLIFLGSETIKQDLESHFMWHLFGTFLYYWMILKIPFVFKQMSLLVKLCCNSVRGIRANFPNQYFGDLQCWVCLKEQDNQSHILQCTGLKKITNVNSEVCYEHIYGTIDQYIPITIMFFSLLEERDRLLEGELAYRGNIV